MHLDLICLEDASPAERAKGCSAATTYLAERGVDLAQGWASAQARDAFEPYDAAHLDAWVRATLHAVETALGASRWDPGVFTEDAELVLCI